MQHSRIPDQNAPGLEHQLAGWEKSREFFHALVLAVLHVVRETIAIEELRPPEMCAVRPNLDRPVRQTAQSQWDVDNIGAWGRRTARQKLPMRSLEDGTPQTSVARDEFAIKIVAEQFLDHAHDQRIGQQHPIIERRAKLRKNSPARGALPEHRLFTFGNLVPGVAPLALDTVLENPTERR